MTDNNDAMAKSFVDCAAALSFMNAVAIYCSCVVVIVEENMSRLAIYHEQNAQHCLLQTQDATVIAAQLAAVGVRFERW